MKLLNYFYIFTKNTKNWFNIYNSYSTTCILNRTKILLLANEKFLYWQISKFSSFYKKKKFKKKPKIDFFKFKSNKKFFNLKQKNYPSKIFYKNKTLNLKKFIFTPSWLFFPKKKLKIISPLIFNFYAFKMLFNRLFFYKLLWKYLLVTIADIKMRAMIEYYDYFALYAIARNYISVHSELHINKSFVKLFLDKKLKKKKINLFFRKIFKKLLSKKKKKVFWKIRLLKLLSVNVLQQRLFKKFYEPLSLTKFEKTDPLMWAFFLDKYLIFWKLLPYSWPDFFGYLSPTKTTEKFLYKYPYAVSSIFYKNLLFYFGKKWKWILSLKKNKIKIYLKKFLFSYSNMLMWKVPTNIFTKRTDAHFFFPHRYVKWFIDKLFEQKKNWISNKISFNFGYTKSAFLIKKKFLTSISNVWLVFALNWSTAKWFYWKANEYKRYINLDYFKKAKYVWWDLTVASFSKFVWKNFPAYAEKFNYNTVDFNAKWLLRVLFPKQKLIEYNLLRSNNLNTSVEIKNVNWKFFSLLKIFWSDWKQKKIPLTDYKLTYPINFDFDKYEFESTMQSLLNDILVSNIYYSHPYENYFDYYKENFYLNKKRKGLEFFFSKNLVLAFTMLRFPIVLNSRLFKQRFYFLFVHKSDLGNINQVREFLYKFKNLKLNPSTAAYKKNFDHFNIFWNILNFLILNLIKWKSFLKTINWFYFFKNFKFFNLLNFNNLVFPTTIFFFIYFTIFFDFIMNNNNKLNTHTSLIKGLLFQLFWFTNQTNKFFKFTKYNVKTYFTQTIWTVKKNPITFFWLNGIRKTKATGVLTAIGSHFNIFIPEIFFNLTINRNNPEYFAYDIWQENSFQVKENFFVLYFSLVDFWINLAKILFDLEYENLYSKNLLSNNSNNLNLIAIFFSKEFVFNAFAKNILDKNIFKFWYNFLINFENWSINFLTSKIKWNTPIPHYFIGPLSIVLFNSNPLLMEFVTSSPQKYLEIIYCQALLETRGLDYPDYVFPFQFNYKKFNLGWKYNLLKIFYKNNFFFFLKETYFPSYFNKSNFNEMYFLTGFVTSCLINLARFNFLNKFIGPDYKVVIESKHLFPDLFFSKITNQKFGFWWLFYGFSKNFNLNNVYINSTNKLLIITFHLGRLFCNSELVQKFLYFENNLFFNFQNKNQFCFENPVKFLFNFSYLKNFFFLFKKFFFFILTQNIFELKNINFFWWLTSKMQTSNFYYFSDISNRKFSFNLLTNNLENLNVPINFFFFEKLNFFFKKKSKIQFFKKKNKLFFNLNNQTIKNWLGLEYLLNVAQFKSCKIGLNENNVWITKALKKFSFIFFEKYKFFTLKKKTFIVFIFKSILFLIWLIIIFSLKNKKVKFIFLYFYVIFFFYFKKYINFFLYNYNLARLSKFYLYICLNYSKNSKLSLWSLLKFQNYIFSLRWNLRKLLWWFKEITFFKIKNKKKIINFNKSLSFFIFFLFSFGSFFYLKQIFYFNNFITNFKVIFSNLFISPFFFKKIFLSNIFFYQIFSYNYFWNFFFQPYNLNFTNIIQEIYSQKLIDSSFSKLNMLIIKNSKWKILLKESFFWFSFSFKFFLNLKDKIYLSFTKKKINKIYLSFTKKKINKIYLSFTKKKINKIYLSFTKKNFINFTSLEWVKWFFIFSSILLWLYNLTKWQNWFKIFRKLMHLFFKKKILDVKQQSNWLDKNTPKLIESAKWITNFWVKRTLEINKETWKLFFVKNFKKLLKNFFLFFTTHSEIPLSNFPKLILEKNFFYNYIKLFNESKILFYLSLFYFFENKKFIKYIKISFLVKFFNLSKFLNNKNMEKVKLHFFIQKWKKIKTKTNYNIIWSIIIIAWLSFFFSSFSSWFFSTTSSYSFFMKKFLKIFFFSLNFFVKFTKCYLTDSRKLLIQMLNTTKYLFFSTQNFIKKFSHLKFKNNFFYNFKLQQFNKNPILNVIKSFILIKSNYLKWSFFFISNYKLIQPLYPCILKLNSGNLNPFLLNQFWIVFNFNKIFFGNFFFDWFFNIKINLFYLVIIFFFLLLKYLKQKNI